MAERFTLTLKGLTQEQSRKALDTLMAVMSFHFELKPEPLQRIELAAPTTPVKEDPQQ